MEGIAQYPYQQPLGRSGSLLRYGLALIPIVFFGIIRIYILARDPSRLGEAVLDASLSVIGLVLLRWRRGHPLLIAILTALLTLGSPMAAGPAFVAYVSLCTHKEWARIFVAAAVLWLSFGAFNVTQGGVTQAGISQPMVITMAVLTISLVALTLTGLYARSRRELAISQAEQVAAAEREERERFEQVKLGERARIAREMHDVLAHRLSLLSLHAGALAHRSDLSPAEIREAAAVIQENAHQSLNELRAVVGELRSEPSAEPPQPSYAELGNLFAEVRAAGQHVDVIDEVANHQSPPPQVGRHAYRIIQEALTNARKHAPAEPVSVELRGSVGAALNIRVSNPIGEHTQPVHPGGMGLVGLSERASLMGGSLAHGIRVGRFVVDAVLPWKQPS